MSRGEIRAALQGSTAVEQQDFEFGAVIQYGGGNFPGFGGYRVTQGGALRQFEGLGGGVGVADFCGNVRGAAGLFGQNGESWQIDFAAYGLEVLSRMGLIWDVHRPPAAVLAVGRQPLGPPTATQEATQNENIRPT